MNEQVDIQNRDYWIKVLAMLQQNWAIIEKASGFSDDLCTVFFIDDNSCVFDRLQFASIEAGTAALQKNGFVGYSGDPDMLKHIPPPSAPFYSSPECEALVYSSGGYWG